MVKQNIPLRPLKDQVDAGTGGSGGLGINYIDNYDFEDASVTGWETYVDTAQIDPEDGTSVASANVTITSNLTTPLRGTYDALLSKDAADRQGEGWSYDFTIDSADKATMLAVSFDYSVSADFLYGTNGDPSDPSDVTVWVYNVNESELIQLAPYTLDGSGKFYGVFQTKATSTNYRLILHISGDNTDDWTMNIDNVFVGPQTKSFGPAMSDWTYGGTVTIRGSTSNPTKGTVVEDKFYYRRVGDSLEVNFAYEQSSAGSAGSGNYEFVLPNGWQIDSNKIANDPSGQVTVGAAYGYSSSTSKAFTGTASVQPDVDTDYVILKLGNDTAAVENVSSTRLDLNTTIIRLGAEFKVPIAGWSSNTLVSSDADTRVVAAQSADILGITLTSGSTVGRIGFNTTVFDTHGGMVNAGSGSTSADGSIYTVPVAGKYSVNAQIGIQAASAWSAGDLAYTYIYVNNSPVAQQTFNAPSTGTYTPVIVLSRVLDLNVGDTVQIVAYQTSGSNKAVVGNADTSWFEVERISGPAQIAASEVVAFKANAAGSQSGPDTTAGGFIEFAGAVEIDTHGAWDGTDTYTIPVNGIYEITAWVYGGSINMGTNSASRLHLNIDGVTDDYLWFTEESAANTAKKSQMQGSVIKNLKAGQTVRLNGYIDDNTGGWTVNNASYMCIKRIGGVM